MVQGISGCLCAWIIFCQRRRFAAYHEQGQAPAPRRSSTVCSSILPKQKGGLKRYTTRFQAAFALAWRYFTRRTGV
ncbi:MAG: hypothetical protein Q4A85_11470 [Kingella sp. (in: b-proteobacteria)]|nr:hypothetical protein [Kingella sp. (in: b-proteobacteria)]